MATDSIEKRLVPAPTGEPPRPPRKIRDVSPEKGRKNGYTRNVHVSQNTDQALYARAYDLGVPVARLVRDVLECWLAISTDWDDPIFNRDPIKITPVPMPVERYPGYIRDLGFE